MAFVKYKTKDNAFSTLLVGISAGATSMQVQAGAGVKFPSSNFVGTIVQYATLGYESSAVVKREKVLVSNNATDTFTITRGFDGDTPVAFNAGDFIYLHNVSAITTDIQDEVSRLETAKLNIGALRTGLANAWRLFFSNGSSAETALALGATGSYLKSTGVSSSPIWDNPPLDINGQTIATDPSTTWTVPLFNGTSNVKTTLANLVKGLATATTSQAGVVEMAIDAEALAGLDELRYINSKQAKDNYLMRSDTIIINKTLTDASQSNTYSHNLGKIPKQIKFSSIMTWVGSSVSPNSEGSYSTINNSQACISISNAGNNNSSSTGYCIMYGSKNDTNVHTGQITTVTDTNFTINWTKTNSPTGNLAILVTLLA